MNQQVNTGEIFVGRKVQLAELKEVINSNRSEFIAVYGRRRVGKTFLIRKAVENKFTFYFTAANHVTKNQQLTNFAIALKYYSGSDILDVSDNWITAFSKLGDFIYSLPKNENKIIFFDELPWADTPKSGFLGAFENFWNTYCAFRNDIKLIVCGSATSWIINKIIHNRGGLHGRITHRFIVEPFNLKETKEYFQAYNYRFNERQLAEIYMVLGGIPYYFSLMKSDEGVAKNIDNLFFANNSVLKGEFEKLYAALYKNPALHLAIIKELSKKGIGLTRQELISNLKITGNGTFSSALKELEECGFIRCYLPFEKTNSNATKSDSRSLYQLIDLFSLFYLRFVNKNRYYEEDFWTSHYKDPELNIWRGIAFEKLCLWHIPQIKETLGITGVGTRICSWTGTNEEGERAQIDLLLDRRDDVINICEIKYSSSIYVITKKYAQDLDRKLEIFLSATRTKKLPVFTFITTEGVKVNEYSDLVQKNITLSDLFR